MTKPLIPALLLLLTGCATLIQGPSQHVAISSTPPGAVVTVDGVEVGVTPAVAKVSRHSSHTLAVTLAGHAPQSQTITPNSRLGLLWWNSALLHPVTIGAGFSVDLLTRSYRNFDRDEFEFLLERADPSVIARQTPVDAVRASLPVGARVRVLRLDLPVPQTTIGVIRGLPTDTLVLESAVPSAFHRIPNRSIESIDLSMGPDRARSALRGAGLGALLGVLAGLYIGASGDAFSGIIVGGLGAMAGAAGGAALGAMAGPIERWNNVCCEGAR